MRHPFSSQFQSSRDPYSSPLLLTPTPTPDPSPRTRVDHVLEPLPEDVKRHVAPVEEHQCHPKVLPLLQEHLE